MKNAAAPSIVYAVMLLAVAVTAEAQQPKKMYKIGILDPGSQSSGEQRWVPFRQKLSELGYVEDQSIVFVHRYADSKPERLPDLAAELVRLNVDVIVTTSATPTLAAKNATASIPIVMEAGDPVGSGLVASLARPGGNVTGLSAFARDLAGKRLELLREVLPKLSHVAVLWNSSAPPQQLQVKEIEAAAHSFGLRIYKVAVQSASDFNGAFSSMSSERVQALVVAQAPFFSDERSKIVALAAKYKLPTMYGNRPIVEAGGLMFYGVVASSIYARMAVYVDKIVKGTKPADLPVEQPMKFDLVINLKAAKQIGLTIPPNVLARADKVIC